LIFKHFIFSQLFLLLQFTLSLERTVLL
jgi:hypothetical protein